MRDLGCLLVGLALLSGCDEADPRPLGPDDAAAMTLCEGFAETPMELTAALSEDDAASVVIEREGLYRVTLPAGAESYAMLRTDTMHATMAIGAAPAGILHNLSVGLPGATQSAVCPAVVVDEHRVHIHAPDDYLLTFSSEGERTALVYVTMAEVGHPDGDGGMHHDHDGGAHHGHDGGMHHEHDGGAHHEPDGGAHHDDDGGMHHH